MSKPLIRRKWTKAEEQQLRTAYPNTPTSELAAMFGCDVNRVYYKAKEMGLKKSAEFLASPMSGRLSKENCSRGLSTRFAAGHASWNNGMTGLCIGGKETQFKRGNRPQTWVPIGTEVIGSDGYLKRKIRDDAAPGMSRKNWKFVHVILWEEHHGPIPAGHAVIFKDGNRENITIENLDLISRDDLMRRNTIHRYPYELRIAIRTVGRLRKTIREASNEEQG